MFFRRRRKEEEDESQFGQLDELVSSESSPVADGIRRALQRDDLSAEDRADFEAALKRLSQGEVSPS